MAQSQIDALEKALHQFRLDVGSYPTTEQGLAALITSPDNNKKWQGPYLSKNPPPDPWGRPYIYKYPGEHNDFDLFTHGKDGQPGGENEMADITNW
jgi:general secretion pathway protein G